MNHCKCYFLGLALLFSMPGFALSISNFEPTSNISGYIEISELNEASFLDVLVKLDGTSINYVLEQVSDDLIVVSINDALLGKPENLIEVSASSEFNSATRSFVYLNSNVQFTIVSEEQARDAYTASLSPVLKQVIVPSNVGIDDSTNVGEFKDGVFHINITKGQTSVGTAVQQLARVNKINVLILPGDRPIHDSILVSPVTAFEDLYLASDRLVKHVHIDRLRNMIRITGDVQPAQNVLIEADQQQTTSIGQLLKDIARVNNYTPLIYPGDAEALLNELVSWEGIKGIDDLALLVGKNGGRLDIDRVNRLIRVRKFK